jgi:hypothetical protein
MAFCSYYFRVRSLLFGNGLCGKGISHVAFQSDHSIPLRSLRGQRGETRKTEFPFVPISLRLCCGHAASYYLLEVLCTKERIFTTEKQSSEARRAGSD